MTTGNASLPEFHVALRWAVALTLLASGCTGLIDGEVYVGQCEGIGTQTQAVVNGSETPLSLPLSNNDLRAVGEIGLCSGTLVRPRWVATATHCGISTTDQFCASRGFGDARDCIDVARVIDHPDRDLTLVELTEDARGALGLVPIAEIESKLDAKWLCREVEGAGLGTDEQNKVGNLRFARVPIVELTDRLVRVDGEGRRGFCRGDSGGPLFAFLPKEGVRLIGTLSFGANSCVGRDAFIRLDVVRDWLIEVAGVVEDAPAAECLTPASGACLGPEVAAACTDLGEAAASPCMRGERCGYDIAQQRFACVLPANDPCGGLDERGTCDGEIARRCIEGERRERDCRTSNERCKYDRGEGARCEPAP